MTDTISSAVGPTMVSANVSVYFIIQDPLRPHSSHLGHHVTTLFMGGGICPAVDLCRRGERLPTALVCLDVLMW
jgi:hypothetical protein